MRTFETEYKSCYRRFLNFKNFYFLALFMFYTYLIFNFKPLTLLDSILLELLISIFFVIFILHKNKTNIHIITFDENNIIIEGETFNRKWKQLIDINKTEINLKSEGSRSGICGVIFYLKFKSLNKTYKLNTLETFSDEQIFEIFNEFKNLKKEKIIIDEKIILNRIQEKIEKCQ